MKWQWPWRRPHKEEIIRKRVEAEEKLQQAQEQTPAVEKAADKLARLPRDQFAERVTEAFRRRHA